MRGDPDSASAAANLWRLSHIRRMCGRSLRPGNRRAPSRDGDRSAFRLRRPRPGGSGRRGKKKHWTVLAIGLFDLIERLGDQKALQALAAMKASALSKKSKATQRWKLIKHEQEPMAAAFRFQPFYQRSVVRARLPGRQARRQYSGRHGLPLRLAGPRAAGCRRRYRHWSDRTTALARSGSGIRRSTSNSLP
jgi:hypothetical protein